MIRSPSHTSGAAIALCLLALAATPSRAQAAFSMLDGASLDMDSSAVHVRLGVPYLGVDYLADQMEELDLGFSLLANYLHPYVEPAFLVRWQILVGEEYNIGLIVRAGLHWNMALWRQRSYPRNFGLRLNPAFVLGMNPHPAYSSYFLFEVPFLWTWGYGGGYALPIRAGMGFEYAMTPDLKFVAYGGAGPRFEGGGGHVGGVFLDLDIWLGMSFQMF
jgi:hypothetical protein